MNLGGIAHALTFQLIASQEMLKGNRHVLCAGSNEILDLEYFVLIWVYILKKLRHTESELQGHVILKVATLPH